MTTNHTNTPPQATTGIGNINDEPRTAHRQGERRLTGWLAVVDDGRLVGVLGRSDLLDVFDRDDDDLYDEIVFSLRHRLDLEDPTTVRVRVDKGVVTLSGHLPTLSEARRVTEFVERLEGVVSVIHGLTYDVERPFPPPSTEPLHWMA